MSMSSMDIKNDLDICCACGTPMHFIANTESIPIMFIFRCRNCLSNLYIYSEDPDEYKKTKVQYKEHPAVTEYKEHQEKSNDLKDYIKNVIKEAIEEGIIK